MNLICLFIYRIKNETVNIPVNNYLVEDFIDWNNVGKGIILNGPCLKNWIF